jgi:hypothetical protein
LIAGMFPASIASLNSSKSLYCILAIIFLLIG